VENFKNKEETYKNKELKTDGFNFQLLLLSSRETIIFITVTIIIFLNYYISSFISSIIYSIYITNSKIENLVGSQVLANERYNSSHRRKIRDIYISSELDIWQSDLKINAYSVLILLVFVPIFFGILYLLFIQMNLRSKFRLSSTILSFIFVFMFSLNYEFNALLLEGDGIIFIVNCIVPFITSFFLCLFVLLTPKNGRFSYYN
jgi:hypothetical protein